MIHVNMIVAVVVTVVPLVHATVDRAHDPLGVPDIIGIGIIEEDEGAHLLHPHEAVGAIGEEDKEKDLPVQEVFKKIVNIYFIFEKANQGITEEEEKVITLKKANQNQNLRVQARKRMSKERMKII